MQFSGAVHRLHGLCLHLVQMPIWCSLTMTTTMVGLRQALLLLLHIPIWRAQDGECRALDAARLSFVDKSVTFM